MAFADKVAQAPESPGVYLLKDARGRVMYIGKARSLRDRLRAYIQPSGEPRIAAMQKRLADVETVVTRSEVEALVLEENFVKIKKPRYNVRLRDDKKFPYLKITAGEPFPRIFVTRNLRPEKPQRRRGEKEKSGAESENEPPRTPRAPRVPAIENPESKIQNRDVFFGPYTSARELRRALKAVKRIFRMRTCKRDLAGVVPKGKEHPQITQITQIGSGEETVESAETRFRPVRPQAARTTQTRSGRESVKSAESADTKSGFGRPCLDFDLGRCSGPCTGRVSVEQYREQVDDVVRFLSGRSDQLAEEIERRMWRESEARNFERAAILRDQLMALREIRKDQQAVLQDKTSRDIIGLARGAHAAVAAMFRVREGKIVAREEYPLKAGKDVPDAEVLSTVIRSVHTHTHDIPDEIVLPAQIDDADVLEALFAERRGRKVRIVVPERGEKVRLIGLARANAEKTLVELQPEERIPKGNRELAEILGLANVPRLIEGVDISNTQGTNAVGSIVVFRDDRPTRQAYRLFKIRTVTGPDDFAMMEEVLARRVRGLLEKNRPLPDLVLVDGGKGQLAAAVRAYRMGRTTETQRTPKRKEHPQITQITQTGSGQESAESADEDSGLGDIPILGLAKRTDTLYYVDGREITIPVTSPALKLLKRIRDESHRFAVTFHRKLRGRKMVESELDTIPGLGPVRKKALIQHFGSMEKLRLASVADIARVRGIGPALAAKLYERLHPGSPA